MFSTNASATSMRPPTERAGKTVRKTTDSTSKSEAKPTKEVIERQDTRPTVPPATLQSWLYGILNGGQDSWNMRYMESEFFELARQQVKNCTGGFDLHLVMLACAALNAARVRIPAILEAVFEQVKTQVTSSMLISTCSYMLYDDLIAFAREKSEESRA